MHCSNSRYALSGLKAPLPEAETSPSISIIDVESNMATQAEVVIKKRRHLSDSGHEESIHVIRLRRRIKLGSLFEARRIESSHVLRRDAKLVLNPQTTPRTTKDISYFTAQEDSSLGQDGFLLTEIASVCFKSTAHLFVVVSLDIRYEGYAAGRGLECRDGAQGLPVGLVHCVIVLSFIGNHGKYLVPSPIKSLSTYVPSS
ncbi:hypothetical protein FRC00_012981 [Tulasnella sp. 408]|nr:hypothetical protein FRC00_012981 [Tulasnella sp. 408]